MRNEPITDENYYHVLNRGVDKRQIFMDEEDYLRFLHDMYEFNDIQKAPPYMSRKKGSVIGRPASNFNDAIQTIGSRVSNSNREAIVSICCFCLMPNHFHLVLRQIKDNGISMFMQKLGTGYAHYFNLKYKRSGTLFQGRFRAKLIKTDAQMMHLSRYIHVLNPGELIEPQIREGIIRQPENLRSFLKNYKWSSYSDYIGEKNYPSLISKDPIGGYFNDSTANYEKFALE